MPLRIKIRFATNRFADAMVELRRQLAVEVLEEVKRRLK